jgi:hypothetical protein
MKPDMAEEVRLLERRRRGGAPPSRGREPGELRRGNPTMATWRKGGRARLDMQEEEGDPVPTGGRQWPDCGDCRRRGRLPEQGTWGRMIGGPCHNARRRGLERQATDAWALATAPGFKPVQTE